MAEERIKRGKPGKPKQRGKDSGQGQRELTPEELATVSGGEQNNKQATEASRKFQT